MEPELLNFTLVFLLGALVGIVIMLLVNKVRSGSATPRNVQQEFDTYQEEVERHFEETSRKFKNMTEQYQELYQHLSVGATSLCRPDSVAAALADERSPMDKLVDLSDDEVTVTPAKPVTSDAHADQPQSAEKPDAKNTTRNAEPAVNEQANAQDTARKSVADKATPKKGENV